MKRDRVTLQTPFAQIPRWIIEHPDLSDRAVRLYGVLHRWAGLPDGIVPGRKKLAALLRRCSVSSVDRASKELVAVGAITVEKRFDEAGDPTSNLYVLMSSPMTTGSRAGDATPGRVAAPTGSRAGDDQSIPSLNDTQSERTPRLADFTKQDRDRIWDVFVDEFGVPVGGMAHRYRGAMLAALAAGITADQIAPARSRYREGWPTVACNPQALINNWNTFGPTSRLQDVPADIRHLYEGSTT